MNRICIAVPTVLSCAAAMLSGCTSSSPPADDKAPPSRTATRIVSSADPPPLTSSTHAPSSQYVSASQSDGVQVIGLPARWRHRNAMQVADTIPATVPVGRSDRFRVADLFRGLRTDPVGVTVSAGNASVDCGAPFLAVQGHGYAVTCRVTATAKGTVLLRIVEHSATTGALSASLTVPIPARPRKAKHLQTRAQSAERTSSLGSG